jgi:hypothetical protein
MKKHCLHCRLSIVDHSSTPQDCIYMNTYRMIGEEYYSSPKDTRRENLSLVWVQRGVKNIEIMWRIFYMKKHCLHCRLSVVDHSSTPQGCTREQVPHDRGGILLIVKGHKKRKPFACWVRRGVKNVEIMQPQDDKSKHLITTYRS